jgi:hypothetical protein
MEEDFIDFNFYEQASEGFFIASPPRRATLGSR